MFFCFALLVISLVIISGTEGNKIHPLKIRAIGTRKPGSSFRAGHGIVSVLDKKKVLLYRKFLMYVGP